MIGDWNWSYTEMCIVDNEDRRTAVNKGISDPRGRIGGDKEKKLLILTSFLLWFLQTLLFYFIFIGEVKF